MSDLRSDTFTMPCEGMLEAIRNASAGDDCYSEDKEVRALEARVSEMFGKEAAVFTPSGTMSNQLAIKSHTSPGDEVITHERYHVYYYESAPGSCLSGIHYSLVRNREGSISPEDIDGVLKSKPRGPLYGKTTLMVLENTVCSLAGKVFSPEQLARAALFARLHGIRVHLDGARVLNACAASGSSPLDMGKLCDSVSLCFAKGLGAPMGSVLTGTQEFIATARKFRKWFGGALHQAGFMAAACRYALDHVGMPQLTRDHAHARRVYQDLAERLDPAALTRPESNMLVLNCQNLGLNQTSVTKALARNNILVLPWDSDCIRMVFHRGVPDAEMESLGPKIAAILQKLMSWQYRTTMPGQAMLQAANAD